MTESPQDRSVTLRVRFLRLLEDEDGARLHCWQQLRRADGAQRRREKESPVAPYLIPLLRGLTEGDEIEVTYLTEWSKPGAPVTVTSVRRAERAAA